ncbi:MAG: rhomboid family intramembrane serine protease, partial [Gammaproteobacteria bacterium]|nr:rhomboid family intramembrane serine protease [Gammaproteobacteria bacterium]
NGCVRLGWRGRPARGQPGGVAFWAHVGGFLAGLALVLPLRRADYVAAHRAQQARRTSRHRW